ncbi:MAG: hypothetical protein LBQ31_08690, partial [Bacteroidales bacterium]|nr:hypothetical protein [Bacteroidales bacterium]
TNQFDSETNQFDSETNQFDSETNQFDSETNQFDSETNQFPDALKEKLTQLKYRNKKEDTNNVILALCDWRPLTLSQIAEIMNRTSEKNLLYNYITPLRKQGKLGYTIPEMPNHPKQAYRTINKE